jgi:hypothetical protein
MAKTIAYALRLEPEPMLSLIHVGDELDCFLKASKRGDDLWLVCNPHRHPGEQIDEWLRACGVPEDNLPALVMAAGMLWGENIRYAEKIQE